MGSVNETFYSILNGDVVGYVYISGLLSSPPPCVTSSWVESLFSDRKKMGIVHKKV